MRLSLNISSKICEDALHTNPLSSSWCAVILEHSVNFSLVRESSLTVLFHCFGFVSLNLKSEKSRTRFAFASSINLVLRGYCRARG